MTAGQRFVDGPADLELFALRAMNNQPLHVLARVTDDPVGALRRGDEAVITRAGPDRAEGQRAAAAPRGPRLRLVPADRRRFRLVHGGEQVAAAVEVDRDEVDRLSAFG